MSKEKRWDRWIQFAAASGIKLKVLAIHRDDWRGETHYAGLPIKVLGS